MRALISSTQGSGHFGPMMPVIEGLVRRGDEVLIVVPPALSSRVQALDLPLRVAADPPEREVAAIWDRIRTSSRREASALINGELFGRLDTAAMLPTLEDVMNEWRPDVAIHEPAEFGAAIAAERRGIRHVQVAIGLAGVEASSLELAASVLESFESGIVEQIRASAYLSRLPASLDPSTYRSTSRYREVADVAAEPLPDWWSGDESPLVYISFGTVVGSLPYAQAAYRAAIDAVSELPLRALLTLGGTREVVDVGELPTNVHVERWVAQEHALRLASVVLCHGGAGTTFGALATGTPLVIMPMMADQSANADLASSAGAAVVVRPRPDNAGTPIGPVDVPRIRDAIMAVLTDGAYARAAQDVADETRTTPSLDQVLDGVFG